MRSSTESTYQPYTENQREDCYPLFTPSLNRHMSR